MQYHMTLTMMSHDVFSLSGLGVQKTLKAKNVGTLSKKLKMPEITDADRALAAVQVEMQNIRQEIMELWKRLKVSVAAAFKVT